MTTTGSLKIKLKTIAFEAREVRKREIHLDHRGDYLSQKQVFKHGKDQPKPGPRNYPSIEEIEKKLKRGVQEVLDEIGAEYWGLHRFRTVELRRVARQAHLAYNFLRGVPYSSCEVGSYSFPDLKEIETIARDFSEQVGDNAFKSAWNFWAEKAKEYYENKGNLNPKPVVQPAQRNAVTA